MRSACSESRHGESKSTASAESVNHSARGPGSRAIVTWPSGGGKAASWSSRGTDAAGSGPIASTWPASTASGPIAARVSRDREPSTGGTSMPPRTPSTYRMPRSAMPTSSTEPSVALAAV
jgi:hypothetical protein